MSNGTTEADPTEVLAAHWNESERRLYPVATSNPDAYKAAVRLVRHIADALADASTLDGLVERWEGRGQLVTEAVAAQEASFGFAMGETEFAGAGFAMRRRELLAERAERQRRQRIAEARSAGRAWAVIHESGDVGAGLAHPYQCVELHLTTGLSLVSTVEPDPSTMAPNYVVCVAALGDEQGRTSGIDPALFADRETSDPEHFERDRREMRQQVEEAEH